MYLYSSLFRTDSKSESQSNTEGTNLRLAYVAKFTAAIFRISQIRFNTPSDYIHNAKQEGAIDFTPREYHLDIDQLEIKLGAYRLNHTCIKLYLESLKRQFKSGPTNHLIKTNYYILQAILVIRTQGEELELLDDDDHLIKRCFDELFECCKHDWISNGWETINRDVQAAIDANPNNISLCIITSALSQINLLTLELPTEYSAESKLLQDLLVDTVSEHFKVLTERNQKHDKPAVYEDGYDSLSPYDAPDC